MSPRLAALCGAWLLLTACSNAPNAAPSFEHAHLPPGVVARVAADEISLETVQRIARAESIAPVVARDRALSDALFAAGARAAFRDGDLLPVLDRAAAARALLDGLKRDALALGPASDAEVAELTEPRWRELDRPEASRTTHAVALVEKPADDAAAHAVAQRIFEAVRGIADPAEFLRVAKAVPHDGVKLQAERLPAVTGDGRVFDPDKLSASSEEGFDPDFAKAALRLATGEISAPTRTRFGYHVILCEAHLPEHRVPLEERRALLHDEAVKHRAERAKEELLARLSAARPFQVSRASDDLTSRVQVKE
jgi:PPIC-type PPIASE domain